MSDHIIKQIIFGSFYLILFLAFGYGFYTLALKPAPTCFDNRQNQGEEGIDCGGPCQSCALKSLNPISVFIQPQLLASDSQTAAVYFRLKNPNPSYGADRFFYTLDFFNFSGEKIHSLTDSSFIYAGKIKTIIEAPVKIDPRLVAKIEVSISNVNWRPLGEFSAPNLQTRAIKTEISKDQAKISGLVFNNNSFKLSNVYVGVLVIDKLGLNTGASKTVLKDLTPFEERVFNVFAPLAGQTINREATEVFAEGLR